MGEAQPETKRFGASRIYRRSSSMKTQMNKVRMIMMAASLAFSPAWMASAFAQDGVVKADQQKIEQDKQDLKKAKEDAKIAKEKVAQDKASGNQEELKKDKVALKEARRNRREAKRRLKEDRGQKAHDVKNP
jgi:hypothetical protein